MDTKQFLKALKLIIREEVTKAVKQEIATIKPLLENRAAQPTKQITGQAKPIAKAIPGLKPELAQILQETANSMVSLEDEIDDDWGSVGHFDSNDAQAFGIQQQATRPMSNNPDDPTNMFMKDYSKVLNKSIQFSQGSRD